jgi:hypothetical protein
MDILIGIVAIIIGVGVALSGLRYFIMLLPIWAFVGGFLAGAALVTAAFGDGFLSTGLGIVIGLIFGIVFMGISYFYWYFAVLIAAAGAGGVLAASLFSSFGVNSSWLLFIIGLAGSVLFMLGAIYIDYPVMLVIVNTAIAGSAIAIGGFLLVFNKMDRDEIGTGALWHRINDHWFLWIIWAVGAAIGMVSQLSGRAAVRVPAERWTRLGPATA